MLLQACLNGSRKPGDHPALPLTAEALAWDARRVTEAGAKAVHMHPRGRDGLERLDAEVIGAAVAAVRALCPALPVGVSTGAWIEPQPARRLQLITSWGSLPAALRPDFASVNLCEEGAVAVCAALLDGGIGVEAGLWSPADVRVLRENGLADRCVRYLIELVREETAAEAIAVARAIEHALEETGTDTPRLLHGTEGTAWPMLRYALTRGYDVRIGLEDTLTYPDGTLARDNAALIATALAWANS